MAVQLLFNGTLLAFFIYLYSHITSIAPRKIPGIMDGADWPKGLLVLLIFFTIINLINIVRTTPPAERNLSSLPKLGNIKALYKNKLFLGMAILVGYGILLPEIGFLPASFLLATLYIILLGEKRVHFAVLYSLICVVVLFILFYFLLDITLPRGDGVFRDFAIFIETLI
jgi:hypothetical protein